MTALIEQAHQMTKFPSKQEEENNQKVHDASLAAL